MQTDFPKNRNLAFFQLTSMQVYIKSFTAAIQEECRPYGVEVQLLSPYFVCTKLTNYSNTVSAGSVFIPDVESYGKYAVFTLGKTNETTGHWSHAIQVVSCFRLGVHTKNIFISFIPKFSLQFPK